MLRDTTLTEKYGFRICVDRKHEGHVKVQGGFWGWSDAEKDTPLAISGRAMQPPYFIWFPWKKSWLIPADQASRDYLNSTKFQDGEKPVST